MSLESFWDKYPDAKVGDTVTLNGVSYRVAYIIHDEVGLENVAVGQ